MWAFNEAMEATSQVPCVLFISDTCHMSDPNPHLFPTSSPLQITPTHTQKRTHPRTHTTRKRYPPRPPPGKTPCSFAT